MDERSSPGALRAGGVTWLTTVVGGTLGLLRVDDIESLGDALTTVLLGIAVGIAVGVLVAPLPWRRKALLTAVGMVLLAPAVFVLARLVVEATGVPAWLGLVAAGLLPAAVVAVATVVRERPRSTVL